MVAKVSWLGYEFVPYEMDSTTWNDVGGVYLFCHLSADGGMWLVSYAGKAKSFASRLTTSHEQWKPAQKLGATHVLATVESLEANRVALEQRLIESLQPPLNVQLK